MALHGGRRVRCTAVVVSAYRTGSPPMLGWSCTRTYSLLSLQRLTRNPAHQQCLLCDKPARLQLSHTFPAPLCSRCLGIGRLCICSRSSVCSRMLPCLFHTRARPFHVCIFPEDLVRTDSASHRHILFCTRTHNRALSRTLSTQLGGTGHCPWYNLWEVRFHTSGRSRPGSWSSRSNNLGKFPLVFLAHNLCCPVPANTPTILRSGGPYG